MFWKKLGRKTHSGQSQVNVIGWGGTFFGYICERFTFVFVVFGIFWILKKHIFLKKCIKILHFIAAFFLYFQHFHRYFGLSIWTKRQISLSSLVRLVRNSRLTLLLLGYFEFLKSILVFPSRLFWIISIFWKYFGISIWTKRQIDRFLFLVWLDLWEIHVHTCCLWDILNSQKAYFVKKIISKSCVS